MDTEMYTAKDVLDLYLEFESLQSDEDTWTEDDLQSNPPRLYRLKGLESLFRAFDLGDIKKFAQGTFISERSIQDYSALIMRMKSELKTITKFRKGEQITLREIVTLFTKLMDYRRRWNYLVEFSSGLYACSAKNRYAYYKIDEVNGAIQDEIAPIDDILTFIISPSKKAVSKEELIKYFGYPDANLFDIDAEWI